MLAVLLAGRFLAWAVPVPPSSLGDVRLMGLLVAAAVVFTLVDAALAGVVRGYRQGVAGLLLDIAMVVLDIALAWAVVDSPLVVPLLAAALVVLDRGGVGATPRAEPTADAGTGALTASAWWDAVRVQPAPASSVLVLDLDRFGDVNARHGHRVGDAVLRAIADALRDELPPPTSSGAPVAASSPCSSPAPGRSTRSPSPNASACASPRRPSR